MKAGDMIKVRVDEEGRGSFQLPPEGAGSSPRFALAEFLARHGFPLNTRCGGRGLCNGCEVLLSDSAAVKACAFPLENFRERERATTITIPRRSLLRQQPSVVDDFRVNIPMARDPLAPDARLGAAIDIGTTTVAVLLCDLENGKTLARASAFNAQMRHGEDVITRIEFCRAGGMTAVRELQRAIAGGTIQPLLDEVCAKAGATRADIGVAVVAGNTTMQHLLAGENPAPLGAHPFTPVFLETRSLAARGAGLEFGAPGGNGNGGARVHLLPGLSSYVGADIAAGLVATGMIYDEGPSLLIDVGTNGEIVAKAGGRLAGCATAAGPAFEGAGLSCGTRAVRGAVERIRLGANPFEARLDIIGGNNASRQPTGLCGSAYVDFLWEARRAGLLMSNGRFVASEKLSTDARGGKKLRLGPDSGPDSLSISEQDIARLLQAKAAIGAGMQTLLAALGIAPRDVRRVYLAGGFGMRLSLEHAIGCGLLPGFEPAQIQIVGNTSLAGAYLAMNDRSLLAEMQSLRARFEPVELNLQPGFEDTFIDNLALP